MIVGCEGLILLEEAARGYNVSILRAVKPMVRSDEVQVMQFQFGNDWMFVRYSIKGPAHK